MDVIRICAAAGIELRDLNVQVIITPTLRLDLPADRARLEKTVADLVPQLLVLDPFVRCIGSTKTPQARSPQ